MGQTGVVDKAKKYDYIADADGNGMRLRLFRTVVPDTEVLEWLCFNGVALYTDSRRDVETAQN